MITHGLMQNGQERMALELLYEKELGPNFNEFTFSIVLSLAAALTLLDLGMQIHGHVIRCEIGVNGFIRTSLVDMYCKCGKVAKANVVLVKLPAGSETIRNNKKSHEKLSRQTVSYSSLISGYVLKGDFESAFRTFRSMVCGQLKVNEYIVTTSTLSVCASTGILGLGLQLHAYIQKVGHKMDVPLRSSLIDMYSKCGSLEDAKLIF
ncbi:pentatricopeptide repeat-containing protein At3g26630, chloroplastic-like [Punica granatum]|uniref:Pentatricopeptide repeat-containing protein At3g26630, chloroplastic-like n=2 Tax=Punica granatum TaxID=22663 RepID=A0A6P8EJY6_PUNGR|nr:pentatricopeptide repeat-containing protein At3g26630, chloroplastic-like [Punica granatum]